MYSKLPYAFKGAAAGALALGALLAPTSASAVLTIEGIDLPLGPVFKGSTIFENTVDEVGEELSGVGRVTTIEDGGGGEVWSPDANRELTYTFEGFLVERIVQDGDEARIFFSGGTATFFSDPTPDFDVSVDQTTAFRTAGAFNADGTPGDAVEFLNLVGAQTETLQLTVDTDFSGAGEPITLIADLDLVGGSLTEIISGTNAIELAFLSVDLGGSGAANGAFDTNTFAGETDVQLASNFSTTNAGGTAFPLRGTADFNAFVVPEPSTLGLFGIGLIGLGFAARRRRQR